MERFQSLTNCEYNYEAEVKTIGRKFGLEILDVMFPSVIVEYQTHIDGVDMGDQHIVMGASFANVAYLKNGTRKYSWGLRILAVYKLMLHGIYLLKSSIQIVGEGG